MSNAFRLYSPPASLTHFPSHSSQQACPPNSAAFICLCLFSGPLSLTRAACVREHGCGAIHCHMDVLPVVRALNARCLIVPRCKCPIYDFTLTRVSLVPALGRHLKLQSDLQYNSHDVPRRHHSTAFLPNLGFYILFRPPLTDIPRHLEEMIHMLFLGCSTQPHPQPLDQS